MTVLSMRATAMSWLHLNEGLVSEIFLALVTLVLPNVVNVS